MTVGMNLCRLEGGRRCYLEPNIAYGDRLMIMTNEIDNFWNEYLLTLPEEQRGQRYFEAASWGNSDELADRIARLILAGVKTTTSRLEWEREKMKDPIQKIGDKCVVLDAQQKPVCITEVKEVFIIPFNRVDAGFVYHYGEGSRDMDFWNNNMWAYYEAICLELGLRAALDMPIICEVFKVIFKPVP
jgi:uncharacterized protein YhfF